MGEKFGRRKILSIFALAIGEVIAVNKIGSIAQLVQSICLTSRGSGVRIPVLPQYKLRSYDEIS